MFVSFLLHPPPPSPNYSSAMSMPPVGILSRRHRIKLPAKAPKREGSRFALGELRLASAKKVGATDSPGALAQEARVSHFRKRPLKTSTMTMGFGSHKSCRRTAYGFVPEPYTGPDDWI